MMLTVAAKLAPIFVAFGLGYLAKAVGLLSAKAGSRLLKFTFYITIPALVFVSSSGARLSGSLVVFLLLPVILVIAGFLAARVFRRGQHLAHGQGRVFEAAPMIINSGFALAFLLALYGSAGVTRVVIFNILNNPLIFIWAFAVVAAGNAAAAGWKYVARKVLISPPLWALILGLAWNITGLTIPGPAKSALLSVGNLTGILIVIALGLVFAPSRLQARSALLVVALRSGLGLVVGLVLVSLLHLTGIDRTALLLLAAAPVGFNLLTFVSMEKQDEAYAAGIVSYSVIASLVLSPLIILLSA